MQNLKQDYLEPFMEICHFRIEDNVFNLTESANAPIDKDEFENMFG